MQEKNLTAKNLVAFDYDAINIKYDEIDIMHLRKNATRKQETKAVNLEVLLSMIEATAYAEFDNAVYVKQLYHMNAWIYECNSYVFLKSWNTVIAFIDKTSNTCIDFVDYIFHNIPVEGFNDDNTYFYNSVWGYIPRKDTTKSSKRQVSRFARLYNANTIAYKELT